MLIMNVYGGVYADYDVVPCAGFEEALGTPPPPLMLLGLVATVVALVMLLRNEDRAG